MSGVTWFLGWGVGEGPPGFGGCEFVCREPIVHHYNVYGVQYFYVFIML